jgi:hypothetical protein
MMDFKNYKETSEVRRHTRAEEKPYLLLLYGLINKKRCPRRFLLCDLSEAAVSEVNRIERGIVKNTDLLRLDGMREFRGEGNMRNGDVVQYEIEASSSHGEIFSY